MNTPATEASKLPTIFQLPTLTLTLSTLAVPHPSPSLPKSSKAYAQCQNSSWLSQKHFWIVGLAATETEVVLHYEGGQLAHGDEAKCFNGACRIHLKLDANVTRKGLEMGWLCFRTLALVAWGPEKVAGCSSIQSLKLLRAAHRRSAASSRRRGPLPHPSSVDALKSIPNDTCSAHPDYQSVA